MEKLRFPKIKTFSAHEQLMTFSNIWCSWPKKYLERRCAIGISVSPNTQQSISSFSWPKRFSLYFLSPVQLRGGVINKFWCALGIQLASTQSYWSGKKEKYLINIVSLDTKYSVLEIFYWYKLFCLKQSNIGYTTADLNTVYKHPQGSHDHHPLP